MELMGSRLKKLNFSINQTLFVIFKEPLRIQKDESEGDEVDVFVKMSNVRTIALRAALSTTIEEIS